MRKPYSVLVICVLALVFSASGLAQSKTTLVDPKQAEKSAQDGLLPSNFAGWQKAPEARTSKSPDAADPANPQILKEYGFTDSETATYTRGDRKMTVKAERFADATGAYGAFTFYRKPEMAH